MSTTPNQKDLLAKKSDLEGILKPDDNDVLHLPGVTITLAESGQFYLAGIDKKLLTLVGNTSGNAVTLDGDAGLTFTTSGGSSTITGITSSNGNSTSLAASQSMASAKQDKIVAGSNITIAQDGKTISATDTNELENLTDVNITTPTDGQGLVYNNTTQKWENGTVSSASSIDTLTDVNLTNLTNGQILKYNSTSQEWENANESGGGGGSTVIPNPTGTPTDTLDTVSIDGTIYEIQGGGGGSSITTLFENDGTTSPASITLEDDLTNYDIVLFQLGATSGDAIFTMAYNVADLTVGDTIGAGSATNIFVWYYYTNSTTLTLRVSAGNVYISTIVGIKLGGGSGGGGSTFEGLDYANKTSLNIPDATGYTYTPTENGALLLTGYGSASVICESTSELLHLKLYDDTYSTVWILIEKDVTYTIKKGGGSGSSFGSGSVLYFIPLKNSSSGGSSVTPNPTGTATDTLSTIEIDGTIYDIEGSGGGTSKYTEEVLWSGNESTSRWAEPIVLNIDITDYDMLSIRCGASNETGGAHIILTSEIPSGNSTGGGTVSLGTFTENQYSIWLNKDNNILRIFTSTGVSINVKEVVGIKYGSGGGGGSGYTEEVIYSATPSTAAPNTLTLTKPYTDFDMLLFNLYRSADGVMNKHDRVVLTSKLSLNDRIQLITYNEWASYDITTTTSFTLINENSMYIGSVVGLKFGEGGGSSEITYSTTEHRVGTWIDGSNVYEKTISISNVSLSSGSYETVDTITGLDTIISCNGYVVEGNLKYTLNDITLRVIQDGTSVKFYSPSGTTWTISSGAIIIRYTKTT